MSKNESKISKFEDILTSVLYSALFTCIPILFIVYLFGSCAVSAGKPLLGSCEKQYNIEYMFNGNWFCEQDKQESD
jgi:hypothetical protein